MAILRDARAFKRGDIIGGRYKLTGILGRGGYGAVYAAEHTGTGQPMALKMLSVDPTTTDDDVVARFYREARITAGLTDIHTIRVFDVGQVEDGPLYMAMELLRGPNLYKVFKRIEAAERRMTQHELIALALPVLQSLGEAHKAGLVHRDLKPANIMVANLGDNHSVVKVLDFGIAHTNDSELTGEGQALGTPAYMSPEQVRGRNVDGRADLYSLGVILFRGLTGAPPFDADDSFALAFMHVNEPAPPLRPLCGPYISNELVAVVERAMSKSPDRRFQTAQEMAAALRQVEAATPQPVPAELQGIAGAPRRPGWALGALVREILASDTETPAVVRDAYRRSEDDATQAKAAVPSPPAAASAAAGEDDSDPTVALSPELNDHLATTALDVEAAQGAAAAAPLSATASPPAAVAASAPSPADAAVEPAPASGSGKRWGLVAAGLLALAAGGALALLGLDREPSTPNPAAKTDAAARQGRPSPAAPTQASAGAPAPRRGVADREQAAQLVAKAALEADLTKRAKMLSAAAVLAPDNAAYRALLDATRQLAAAKSAAKSAASGDVSAAPDAGPANARPAGAGTAETTTTAGAAAAADAGPGSPSRAPAQPATRAEARPHRAKAKAAAKPTPARRAARKPPPKPVARPAAKPAAPTPKPKAKEVPVIDF